MAAGRAWAKSGGAQRYPQQEFAMTTWTIIDAVAVGLVLPWVIALFGIQHSWSPRTWATAGAALEQALIARNGSLGRVQHPFLLRSDNGLVFTSRDYTRLVRSYGLKQEFITPHCPQQNGMVERVIRTLKEQCIHRHRFESLQHATRTIGDWIHFYNTRRPHQALGMKTPAEAFKLAA